MTWAAYWFTPRLPRAVQIYIKASNSLWTEREILSLLLYTLTSRVTLWQSWLESILALHSCDPSPHPPRRAESCHKNEVMPTSQLLQQIFFTLFLPVGSGITVGSFFRLCRSLYLFHSLSSPLNFSCVHLQIALWSHKDKQQANKLIMKDILHITSCLRCPPLSFFYSATRNAQGHPVTKWMVAVHLWVQLCPQCLLCVSHILIAKYPNSCYEAEIFSEVQILSQKLCQGSRL